MIINNVSSGEINKYSPPSVQKKLSASEDVFIPSELTSDITKGLGELKEKIGNPVDTSGNIKANGEITGTNPYKIASKYTVHDIMTDPVKAKAFEKDYLKGENSFFSIARDEKTGLIFDGFNLNEDTGTVKDVRFWSAPSKESLDIGICVKALLGDSKAALVVSKNDPSKAKDVAADILKKKMDSYMKYNKENPGYGGFLPWVYIKDDKVTPADGWAAQVPGLDNGEWIWSVLVAEKALKKSGYGEIADSYGKYVDILKDHASKMFYDRDTGKIRGDVKILSPQSNDSAYETMKDVPGRCAYIGDFHEGLMLTLFVGLFGKDISDDDMKKIWSNVSTKRVEAKQGTTWEAWCGSSHESWAYLFLPYRDIPEYKDLFTTREIIRTQNAAEKGYPGLASSINEPGGQKGYLSYCGIEGIGTDQPDRNDTFAIYGAFPLLLEFSDKETPNYGLAWLLNMLKANKCEGPLGGGESSTNDGLHASCMKTVDGTLPNLLGMMGGLEKETGEMLKDTGVYDKFIKLMKGKYDEAFGTEPLKRKADFALPSVAVPTDVSKDYSI